MIRVKDFITTGEIWINIIIKRTCSKMGYPVTKAHLKYHLNEK